MKQTLFPHESDLSRRQNENAPSILHVEADKHVPFSIFIRRYFQFYLIFWYHCEVKPLVCRQSMQFLLHIFVQPILKLCLSRLTSKKKPMLNEFLLSVYSTFKQKFVFTQFYSTYLYTKNYIIIISLNILKNMLLNICFRIKF